MLKHLKCDDPFDLAAEGRPTRSRRVASSGTSRCDRLPPDAAPSPLPSHPAQHHLPLAPRLTPPHTSPLQKLGAEGIATFEDLVYALPYIRMKFLLFVSVGRNIEQTDDNVSRGAKRKARLQASAPTNLALAKGPKSRFPANSFMSPPGGN